MGDQAEKLRECVHDSSAVNHDREPRHVIALVGGQARAGTTTLAVNLAISIARRGGAVVLADVNAKNPAIADSCRLRPKYSFADVLNQRQRIRELLQVGPCGVKVFACESGLVANDESVANIVNHLLESFDTLATADTIVVDAGSAGSPWISAISKHATQLVVITTETPESVLQSYAVIKHICTLGTSSRISVLVNHASSTPAAKDVQARLVLSCERFLNIHLETCGAVPFDERMPRAARIGRPFVVYAPHSQTAHQINAIGQRIELRRTSCVTANQRAA